MGESELHAESRRARASRDCTRRPRTSRRRQLCVHCSTTCGWPIRWPEACSGTEARRYSTSTRINGDAWFYAVR